MTVLKLIECDVGFEQREAFSLAQRGWAPLATCPGLLGQYGGWERAGPAIVWGLWSSPSMLEAFMRDTHDRIAASLEQARTYRALRVHHFDEPMSIGGGPDWARAGFIRMAWCAQLSDPAGFLRDQSEVWNPAMLARAGMVGGHVWRSRSEADAFLVMSAWTNAAAHQRYVEEALPALRARVRPESSIGVLRGLQVSLEPSWAVVPGRSG